MSNINVVDIIVGNVVQCNRLNRGYVASQLALLIGVSTNDLSSIEEGARRLSGLEAFKVF